MGDGKGKVGGILGGKEGGEIVVRCKISKQTKKEKKRKRVVKLLFIELGL